MVAKTAIYLALALGTMTISACSLTPSASEAQETQAINEQATGDIVRVNLANAWSYVGKKVGDGQCVTFIRTLLNTTKSYSSLIKKGNSLTSSNLGSVTPGTVIATFDTSGNYNNVHTAVFNAALFDVVKKQYVGATVVHQNWYPAPYNGVNTKVGASNKDDLYAGNLITYQTYNANNQVVSVTVRGIAFSTSSGMSNLSKYSIAIYR